MTSGTLVALDIGRSSVKATAYSNGLKYGVIFPSIVSRISTILNHGTLYAVEHEIVEMGMNASGGVDGDTNAKPERYFTGESARIHSDVSSKLGLYPGWIETEEYAVLVKSAKKRFAAQGVIGLDDALIVVGTPSRYFQAQRSIMEVATYDAWPAKIKVLSQPIGAYLSFLLDENGVLIKENMIDGHGNKRSWAVIVVGFYATDFHIFKEGCSQQSRAESFGGVSAAVSHLQRALLNLRGIDIDLLKAERALRDRKIKYRGSYLSVENEVANAIQPIADAIIQQAQAVFADDVGDLDGILLAGGLRPLSLSP